MKKPTLLIIAGLCLLGAIVVPTYEAISNRIKKNKTTQLCENVAKSMVQVEDGIVHNEKDAWGHRLRYVRTATYKIVTHKVTSPGKDGTFGNDDDIEGIWETSIGSEWGESSNWDKVKKFGKGVLGLEEEEK